MDGRTRRVSNPNEPTPAHSTPNCHEPPDNGPPPTDRGLFAPKKCLDFNQDHSQPREYKLLLHIYQRNFVFESKSKMGHTQVYPPCKPDGYDHWAHDKRYVKYVPVGYANTHSIAIGYLFWIIGFTGAHRFYYGKNLTGILWFFTGGLLGIGWLVDLFLIPSIDEKANGNFHPGRIDYNVSWVLLVLGGWLGLHRFYQLKIVTGLIYFLTFGLFGFGLVL